MENTDPKFPVLFELDPLPPQPAETEWAFVDELRTAPYHRKVEWRERTPEADEAFFPRGIRLEPNFPDPRDLLTTAVADFRYFLDTVGLRSNGPYLLVTRLRKTSIREEYRVKITSDSCELTADDTEGIRRGLIWIEDQILRRGGPFLPIGIFRRKPTVRTRISRCFYGPVNRPPKSRDELADDVDYYPDEYLNRLAHEGVNALWFTLHFFQTVPSAIIPEYGADAGPRLEKLRRTVRKCERYGIRIYPFCIEPAAFNWPYPELAAAGAAHPDLKGHQSAFCTSTEKGRAYLEEATRTLFTEVPDLGGLITIPVGERLTHCYSSTIPHGSRGAAPNSCPRCWQRQPWEVLADTLDAAMERGIHSVAPEAELVAWPYGQFICWGKEKTIEAAGHIPKGVILQHNFETGGHNKQLGKLRPAWDYWLSYVGPSDLFQACATEAASRNTRVSAKLQVACSHEVATTQVVPAPGILYKKFRQMRRLQVSSAMLSWYFGTYPSLMTRTAGELSFTPFPRSERDFLLSLARRDWGRHAPAVAEAWRHFQKGYTNYPTAHIFGYYGPMHDGPVWPLYLIPRRLPLAPTWQIGYPPSGDYIAECVTNGFTLAETLTLCRRMAASWERGVQILKELRPHFRSDPERLGEIGLAIALGLQFRSGCNILTFYSLREQLADAKRPARRIALLEKMKYLAHAELDIDAELLPLAEADSRLGFHSEAEGYKYFPALIRWRMDQLQHLLEREFPSVEQKAREPRSLFPDYTGEQPTGLTYSCEFTPNVPNAKSFSSFRDDLPRAECTHWLHQTFDVERWRRCAYDRNAHNPVSTADRKERRTSWKAIHDRDRLYIAALCTSGTAESAFGGNELQIFLEPQRTQPRIIFHIRPDGSTRCVKDDGYIPRQDDPWSASTHVDENGWSTVLRIPFSWLSSSNTPKRKPMRINVVRTMSLPKKEGVAFCSWAHQEPVKGRLVWGHLNPATDFGWLRFDDIVI